MKQDNQQFRIDPACEKSLSATGNFHSLPLRHSPEEIRAYLLRFVVTVVILMSVLIAGATNGFTGQERRTVAVVLSGGGAKGIAHIGLLKALEEYEVPVDYIAGTSMGAIIGGLYAAGYSPWEIEEYILSEDFEEASKGIINERYNYYYLQQDPDPTWFNMTFDWNSHLEFQNIIKENIPSNLVSPFLMDFNFMELLAPSSAAAGNDFDSLFIPFRCVASDIVSKKAVIMRDGNLPDAVRASMSFPVYFKPIRINGVLLMDGGMFNNFPADIVLKDFQPDLIIGSVVADNPTPPDPDDLLSQLENMLVYPTDYNVYSKYGVIVKPEVPQLAVTDFSQNEKVIAAGYEATMEKMGEIVSQIDYRQKPEKLEEKRRAFRQKIHDPLISEIHVDGLKKNHANFVKNFLNPHKKPVMLEDIKANYLRLLSFTRFQSVYPRMRYNEEEGSYTLCLQMEKEREFLRGIGGNISSRASNQIFGKFLYRKLSKNPKSISNNIYFGNFYRSANIRGRIDFTGKYAGFVSADFTYSHWNYTTQSVYFFEETPSSYITQREISTSIRAGIPMGYRAKLELETSRVNLKDEYYHTQLFTPSDTSDVTRFSPWVTSLSYEFNTLNRKQMANQGAFLNISLRYVEGEEKCIPGSTSSSGQITYRDHSWWEAQLKYEHLVKMNQWLTTGFVSDIFISNRPLFSNYPSSLIMARQFSPFPLARTRFMPGYRANQYVAGGIKALYSFSRKFHFQAEAYMFQPLKDIVTNDNSQVYYRNFPYDISLIGNLALIYHTPPGPVSASLSYFQNESQPWVFMINFGYILFNRQTFM